MRDAARASEKSMELADNLTLVPFNGSICFEPSPDLDSVKGCHLIFRDYCARNDNAGTPFIDFAEATENVCERSGAFIGEDKLFDLIGTLHKLAVVHVGDATNDFFDKCSNTCCANRNGD
ncbi:MAG: hypothetical protein A3H35_02040 [Betaproteobacteria bacterium RIFCSPLOWO2_02_FULL_62_17]|nr:MAG: hypothetical protein A3H35_02040 [Betaproteobacteria bacterium RIFCSPLOWO2_02_FULL_62_17]